MCEGTELGEGDNGVVVHSDGHHDLQYDDPVDRFYGSSIWGSLCVGIHTPFGDHLALDKTLGWQPAVG